MQHHIHRRIRQQIRLRQVQEQRKHKALEPVQVQSNHNLIRLQPVLVLVKTKPLEQVQEHRNHNLNHHRRRIQGYRFGQKGLSANHHLRSLALHLRK